MAPQKNSDTERFGGPGSSHQNREDPEKSKPRGPHPAEKSGDGYASISGGGGENDRHHTHDPDGKSGH